MIPRLGDGNPQGSTLNDLESQGLENDSPSRGRKHWNYCWLFRNSYWKTSLENDSPSRGRKPTIPSLAPPSSISLENDSPSRGRKLTLTNPFNNLLISLENDSPSRGRKLIKRELPLWCSFRHSLENDSPSRGRKPGLGDGTDNNKMSKFRK